MAMPITLLTGYLGAGKTCLLNNILKNTQGYKVAVIVNDIGEINVDSDLIAKGGEVNMQDKSLVPMQNGCICCTLKSDLIDQIVSLVKMKRFDHIVIEASGVCEPMPIAQTISMIDGSYEDSSDICRLDNIVTVVDANRMAAEFDGGSYLLKESLEEDDIENLLIQQIEFCNTIILNKVDMVREEDKKRIISVIRALQPSAKIIETNYSEVDMKEIVDTKAFDLQEVMNSPGWVKALEEWSEEDEEDGETDEYGISTFVYKQRRPFITDKFVEYASKHFPSEIIRAKGPIWFMDEPDTVYMFEQAGAGITASPFGSWVAANSREVKEQMFREHPQLRDLWDKKYGDRRIELVLIGKDMDKEQICKDLDGCLGE